MAQDGVRFIRVRGRVIPIRSKDGQAQAAIHERKRSVGAAVTGVSIGSSLVALGEGAIQGYKHIGLKRAGQSAAASTALKSANRWIKGAAVLYGVGMASAIYGGHHARKSKLANPKGFWAEQGNHLKNMGFVAGGIGLAIGAHRGLIKAGMALKPYAKQFGEFRKFRNAKPVREAVSGLLSHVK